MPVLRLTLLAAALTLGCSDSVGPDLAGQWGGSGANLSLTPTGGSIDFGCGSASIDSGWTVGPGLRLRGTGVYHAGGGPLPPPGGGSPHPAALQGQVGRLQITFSLIVTDLNDTLGPFVVERGKQVNLLRCL